LLKCTLVPYTTLFRSVKRIWFHCASLGEFEQGRPLIEKIKKTYPDFAICLTFYSPSGYEIRKNYSFADFVAYLPLDSEKNARKLDRKSTRLNSSHVKI